MTSSSTLTLSTSLIFSPPLFFLFNVAVANALVAGELLRVVSREVVCEFNAVPIIGGEGRPIEGDLEFY